MTAVQSPLDQPGDWSFLAAAPIDFEDLLREPLVSIHEDEQPLLPSLDAQSQYNFPKQVGAHSAGLAAACWASCDVHTCLQRVAPKT